ncbi:MAG: energy transducer TonB [Gemmatimonadaceae bacterium]
MTVRPCTVITALAIALSACVGEKDVEKLAEVFEGSGPRPDELPVMLNEELPFRYPPRLYEQRVQGNVTLRIFIDDSGHVHPESTIVAESSGLPELDSAAVRGSADLVFTPARLEGQPIAISILFPVHYRHPQGGAFPADSAIRSDSVAGPSP